MRKKISFTKSFIMIFLIVITGWGAASCTDEFGDVELDIIKGTTDSVADLEIAKGMMLAVMPLIHDLREHKYQYQWNLHIDNYCGYMCVANNLEGRLPSTNFINSDFESGPISNYLWTIRQVVPVINSAEKLGCPSIGAIANIIFCYASQEYTDVHGPMPYYDYRKLKEDPPMEYMPVKDIYYDLLEQLKTSVETLKNSQLSEEESEAIKYFDKIAGGNVSNWIKFANTLRLRIAMHMKKADPEKAQAKAESAVRAGVLTQSDTDVEYAIPSNEHHPLFTICDLWNDTRLNASFEIMMKRLESPMLSIYFAANNEPIEDKNGEMVIEEPNEVYVGIRSGTTVFNKNDNLKAYILYSKLNPNFANHAMPVMKATEALFLRAEGALYGWDMGGTAQKFYEDGIRLSFQREMSEKEALIYYNAYMRVTEPDKVTYVDYYDRNNDFNNEEYKKVETGLNVFVYDVFTESLVESAGFNIENGKMQYTKQ